MRQLKRLGRALLVAVNLAVMAIVLAPLADRIVHAQDASVGGALQTTRDYIVSGFWTFKSGYALGGGIGFANGDQYKMYRVDSIADNTATAAFTVTVPNGNHGAVIPVTLLTALGAGGAVGDFECVGTAYGQVAIERFTGAATVATATALSNTGSACSSGATTITTAYAVSSISGANTATQTFTVTVTVTKGGGSSANHHALIQIDNINANNGGITVS